MALSDGHPHPIPTAAMAAYDPPTYLQQHHSNKRALYCPNNTNEHTADLNHMKNNNNFAAALISPEDEQQLPCEQYKEFLDASHHERADMIDNLVDVSVDIIDSIWPAPGHAKVVATKGFIREILKRSKTTYFMLQISLFYIFRVKRVVQAKLRMAAGERRYRDNLMCCGRRMFLASLMAASKYIHDKSYRNKAWADASGLTLAEINASELAFLQMIDYRLFISKATFEKWYTMLNQRLDQRKQLRQQQQPQQQKESPRSYHQQYNHHCLVTPKAIQKPSGKPSASTMTPAMITKGITTTIAKGMTTTAPLPSPTATMTTTTTTPFVAIPPPSSSLSTGPSDALSSSSHYPSPDSPYY
ncbi:hypothetical protein BCR42DRAFT_349535 [Absidia repens]|uniref:Cyclin-domain-containing protein n=1 Tax=Absidia repens TaxID=90262 RepID=A0A1X2IM69_9FUNG|nr:hypothetical protein BCR42DRAFT_349535 [Absidia repens]